MTWNWWFRYIGSLLQAGERTQVEWVAAVTLCRGCWQVQAYIVLILFWSLFCFLPLLILFLSSSTYYFSRTRGQKKESTIANNLRPMKHRRIGRLWPEVGDQVPGRFHTEIFFLFFAKQQNLTITIPAVNSFCPFLDSTWMLHKHRVRRRLWLGSGKTGKASRGTELGWRPKDRSSDKAIQM